jgi:hypothetical protein
MGEERIVVHNVRDVRRRAADMGQERVVVHNVRDVGHRVADMGEERAVLGTCQVSVTEYLELCSKIMDGLYLLYSEE